MKRETRYSIVVVIVIHLCQLFLFSSFSFSKKETIKPKMVIVTKQVEAPKPIIPSYRETISKEEVTKIIKEEIQEKPIPLKKNPPPKKQTPPKKIQKKEVKKPAPVKKKKSESKQMLKKIDQNLAKMHKTPPQKKPPSSPVKRDPKLSSKVEKAEPLPHLVVDPFTEYYEEVCLLFENTLILPEKGMVKLTISVQANGKIGNIKLVLAESEKNLEYLKQKLGELVLPIPRDGKDVVFTITFCDE